MSAAESESPDVVLIGAGIMSATLGTLLKELEPSLDVVMFETLEDCALESSEAWNNAGTGHAANCELNYTPQRPDGSVDISKALEVNTEFDISRQLWSHLVTKGAIPDPSIRDRLPPLGLSKAGTATYESIERAVEGVLNSGLRTADLARKGEKFATCVEMGQAVVNAIK